MPHLVFEYSQHSLFEQPNHEDVSECHPFKHYSDTSLPKRYVQSKDLQNENIPYIVLSCKLKNL
jgi:hypothetical protein